MTDLSVLVSGLTEGLAAGFSPGTLSALVICESLRFTFRRGMIVALVPLVTDAPIDAVALVVREAMRLFGV